jgi:Uma2 family endonuclease
MNMRNLSASQSAESAGRIVLEDVSWRTYESILHDYEGRSGVRLNYDRGVLEILSPISEEHELYNRLLSFLVETLAEAMGFEYRSSGAATFKRPDLQQSFEPDSCYYLQNEPRVRGNLHLDLTVDPPPDLAIEVDITHSSLDKLRLYAAMGVPELWRYDGQEVSIFWRKDESMVPMGTSRGFPSATAEALTRLMEQSKRLTRSAWNQSVRQWARSLASSHS